MKKAMKKLMAALLAVAMVCAMAIPAFAAGGSAATNFTITAPDNGHTYQIYQIFTGTTTVDATTKKTILSDIKWGKNAVSTYKEGDAVPADILNTLTHTSGETNILTEVKKYVDLTGTPAFTAAHSTPATVPAGYYLIKDIDDAEVASYTLYIVEVVDEDIEITPKTDAPSVEKKVLENTKHQQNDGFGTGYNDTADYHIGDLVPFKLIGRIPDMNHYQTYKYVFHDTLSKAFDAPDRSAIKVSLSDSKATLGTDIDSTFYTVDVTTDAAGETTITVSFNDLKSVSGVAKDKFIVVSYSAKLNAKASIGQGTPGNTNEVYLEYSNNPNNGGTGTTIKDKVIVFTYELDVNKVDGNDSNKKLKGAKFKLLNDAKTQYAKVDDNNKFVEWTDEAHATELESDENGLFKVIGLDDGIYFLKETVAPSGYNTLTDLIRLVISANTSNGQTGSGKTTELTTIDVTVDNGSAQNGTVATGTVSITVENNQGTTLPGTGGIGTTIFYVVGGGLMVAAAVLLITKKRMENR